MSRDFEPTSASGKATAKGLRNYGRFASEYILDRPVNELFNFQNFVEHDPDNTEGMGTGAPEFGEISTSSIGGIKMVNTDTYGFLMVVPAWCDPASQWDFRILWSNSEAAATGSVLYAVTYTPIKVATQATALAAGATALDTVIASDVDAAANVPQWTTWGSISADKTDVKDLIAGTDLISMEITAALTTIADASVLQAQYRVARRYL